MGVVERTLMRTFGRPMGLLGRLGGRIMARTNGELARSAIGLLEVQPDDRCRSAWNKDPAFGVIGIQSGPQG